MLFFVKHKDDLKSFKTLFVWDKNGILKALFLGVGVYAVIVLGYYFTRNIIDYSNVTSSLTESMGITAENFIYVSLYISLILRYYTLFGSFFRHIVIPIYL